MEILATLKDRLINRPPVVSVLRLSGAIGSGGRFARGLEDAALAPLIERAFRPSKLAAVALAINSPGGAPVQSALIAERIRDAAAEKKVPVLAFCEDVAASGGYMLACAADEIFVEANSIVGSIGVVSASFGFHQALDRLGVERRVRTAGENKVRLDPFQPEKAEDVAWLLGLQERIHANFIEFVKAARGTRLGDDPSPELFSGEVWIGADAVDKGLADGLGRLKPTLKQRFGDKVRLQPVTARRGMLSLLSRDATEASISGVSGEALASRFAASALDEIEQRALWARYGL